MITVLEELDVIGVKSSSVDVKLFHNKLKLNVVILLTLEKQLVKFDTKAAHIRIVGNFRRNARGGAYKSQRTHQRRNCKPYPYSI